MGMHYAYADIVLDVFPDRGTRTILTLLYLTMATPAVSRLSHRLLRTHTDGYSTAEKGPLGAILSAATVTGVSFVMDSVMPASVGNMTEDVVRGVTALLLVHSLLGRLSNDVEAFAMWVIARRFSTMLAGYGFLEMMVSVAVCMGITKSAWSLLGGDTARILYDLLILVAVFLAAGWALATMQTGNVGDTVVVLVSMMFIVKTALTIST